MQNKVKNKKGFTLVELLAVIVILAVIAVIAVPQILNIIENSRKDAFKESIRSAFKAAQLVVTRDTTGGQLGGPLSSLQLNNNPFTDPSQGEWFYDKENNVIIINYAKSSAVNPKYQIGQVANKEVSGYTSINSNNIKPFDITSNDLLVNKINTAFFYCSDDEVTTPCIVASGSEKGYVRGPQEDVNNYVSFAGKVWRIVKVNDIGTVQIVTDDVLGNYPYDNDFDINLWECTGACSNNYATADIKPYLNGAGFYNTLTETEKGMIMLNTWLTGDQNGGGTPTTTTAKVGLLTYYDYVVGTKSTSSTQGAGGYDSYLNRINFYSDSIYYWLGTGVSDDNGIAWVIYKDGVVINTQVSNPMKSRPTVVLNSGIFVTGGNGTLSTPYTIE